MAQGLWLLLGYAQRNHVPEKGKENVVQFESGDEFFDAMKDTAVRRNT